MFFCCGVHRATAGAPKPVTLRISTNQPSARDGAIEITGAPETWPSICGPHGSGRRGHAVLDRPSTALPDGRPDSRSTAASQPMEWSNGRRSWLIERPVPRVSSGQIPNVAGPNCRRTNDGKAPPHAKRGAGRGQNRCRSGAVQIPCGSGARCISPNGAGAPRQARSRCNNLRCSPPVRAAPFSQVARVRCRIGFKP